MFMLPLFVLLRRIAEPIFFSLHSSLLCGSGSGGFFALLLPLPQKKDRFHGFRFQLPLPLLHPWLSVGPIIKLFDFEKFSEPRVNYNIVQCLFFWSLFYLSKHISICSQTSYWSCQGSSQGRPRENIQKRLLYKFNLIKYY